MTRIWRQKKEEKGRRYHRTERSYGRFERPFVLPEGSEWWILKNWDNRIEPAGHLAKWWDWDSIGPRYDEYRRLVRARNGNH